MRKKYLFTFVCIITTSCSTMNESLQLGAGLGLATGAVATYSSLKASGTKDPKFKEVALGAGIGLGIGLITSYLTHRNVEEKRASLDSENFEMNFGDLPPSPFIIPRSILKKGK